MTDRQVVHHPQLVEEGRGLKGAGDSPVGDPVRFKPGDLFPLQKDLPVGRPEHAADQPEENRLSGAVRAHDREDFSFPDVERDIVYGHQTGKMFAEILNLKQHPSSPLSFAD